MSKTLVQSAYKGWFVEGDHWVSFRQLKSSQEEKKLDFDLGGTLTIEKGQVFVAGRSLGYLKDKDWIDFQVIKEGLSDLILDRPIMINYQVKRYVLKWVIKDETWLKKYGSLRLSIPNKDKNHFSWIKLVYYLLVIVASGTLLIFSLTSQGSLFVTIFLGLVLVSCSYLLADMIKTYHQ